MSVPEENMPIYDERVNYIIRSLAAGISRGELAKEFKHKDYKSLDMYMRRRNFTWDHEEQNYKPVAARFSKNKLKETDVQNGKVSRIIKLFSEGEDPKTVAKELGFNDHKELAAYMTQKGYEWSSEESNYVRKVGASKEEPNDSYSTNQKGNQTKSSGQQNINQVLMLISNLYDELNIKLDNPVVSKVPRYLIKGIAKTKSVQMSHLLQQLLEDYSFEHNITQRQIFEVAIIDFFRKYGYKNEVDQLLTN